MVYKSYKTLVILEKKFFFIEDINTLYASPSSQKKVRLGKTFAVA